MLLLLKFALMAALPLRAEIFSVAASPAADGASISWLSDEPSDSEVEFGPTESYGSSAFLNAPPATAHSVSLGGLASGAIYHYRAKSRDSQGRLFASGDMTFMTVAASPASADALSALIMNPASGASVSGSVPVSANAAARAGVAGLQFLLDGSEFGVSLATPPYTFNWNTALTAEGRHSLSAVVRDVAGAAATSPVVFVTVDNTPPVISAVAVAAESPTAAVVLWTTSERADSQVDYGPTPEYGFSTILDGSRVVRRASALSGLSPATLYHYRVKSRDAAGHLAVSEDLAFVTAPAAAAAPAAAPAAAIRAPQTILTPALADGINDRAVFGPAAREVTILDLRGRVVFHETASGAPLVWNGRDASGRIVPSGVYIARIVGSDASRHVQALTVAK